MTRRNLDDWADFDDVPDFITESEAAPRSPALRSKAPDRTSTRARRWAALSLSIAWLGMHLAVYGVRKDLADLPMLYVAMQIVVPFLFAIASLALALRSGQLGLGLSVGLLLTVGVLGPLSFLLIAIGAPAPRPVPEGGSFWLGMLVCLDITLSWAAVPLLCAAVSLRRAFAAGASFRAALVGAAAGLLSGAVMNLHCPNIQGAHILLGHGIPMVIATLLGALLVVRWSRS